MWFCDQKSVVGTDLAVPYMAVMKQVQMDSTLNYININQTSLNFSYVHYNTCYSIQLYNSLVGLFITSFHFWSGLIPWNILNDMP